MIINGYEIEHHKGDPQWKGDTGERWLVYNTKDKYPNCPVSSEMSWQNAWDGTTRLILRDNGLRVDPKTNKIKRGLSW